MNLSARFFKVKDPRSIIKALLSSWYVFLILIAAGLTLGYYTAYQKKDVYQSVTEILISGNSSDKSNYGYQGLAGYEAYATISNQKRVIKSYDLLAQVSEKLNWEYTYLQEGRVRSVEMYASPPFNVVEFTQKKGGLGYSFTLDYSEVSTKLILNRGGESQIFEYPANALFFENELVKIQLQSFKPKLIGRFVVEKRSLAQNVASISSSLEISDFEYTSFIKLTYNDVDAQRSKDVLDTLVAVYTKFNVRAKYILNDKTLDFIDTQIEEVTRYINQGEFDLESYKARESIIDIDTEEKRYLDNLVDYDNQIREWELQLNTIDDLQAFLKSDKSASLMPPLLYLPKNEGFITKMLERLYDLEFGEKGMVEDRTIDNPQFNYSDNSAKNIKNELYAYLNETKAAIKKEQAFLQLEVEAYEKELRSLPQDQREIINFKRKIAVNEKLYNFLLEKRAGVIIDRATISSAAEVVEQPRLIGRIGPNRAAIRNSYITYSLILALIITAIRFFFFQKFKTVPDLKQWSELPVLAGVKSFKKEFVPNTDDYPKQDIAEHYRKIRANLQYLDASHKTILLTSMFPGEGKTHNAVHISALKALGDKKTILLDFDMHKPSVHKKLKIDNTQGMSSLLSGAVDDYTTVTQEIFPNFYVIPSGVRPPNPSELVYNVRTKELFEELKKDFDCIVIDTPPLHLITDAKELQKYTDVYLLVLNTRNATRQTVVDIEDFVEEYSPKNFSVILNGVKTAGLLYKYGNYRYKYAYKYGYGYGAYGGTYGSKKGYEGYN